MAELFRFWRTLPRASMGFALVVVIASAAFGADFPRSVAQAITVTRNAVGETATGIILTLAVIATAALGTEVSRTLALPLRTALGWLLTKVAGSSTSALAAGIRHLGAPPLRVSHEMFHAHRQFINDYYEGWSRGAVTTPEMHALIRSEWKEHFELFTGLINHLGRAPHELWYIALFTSVTQEQVLAEYLEASLESIHAAWLTFLFIPLALMRFGFTALAVGLSAGILVAIALLMTPTYRRRKVIFAVLLIYSHMTAFQFGKLAEVTDREAE